MNLVSWRPISRILLIKYRPKGTRPLSCRVLRICTVLLTRSLSSMLWRPLYKSMSPCRVRYHNKYKKECCSKWVGLSKISFVKKTAAPWLIKSGKSWKTKKLSSTSSLNLFYCIPSSIPTTRKSRSSWNISKPSTTTHQCSHSSRCWVNTKQVANPTSSTSTTSRRKLLHTSSASSKTYPTYTPNTSHTFSKKSCPLSSKTE